jgi:hypothetical protein
MKFKSPGEAVSGIVPTGGAKPVAAPAIPPQPFTVTHPSALGTAPGVPQMNGPTAQDSAPRGKGRQ